MTGPITLAKGNHRMRPNRLDGVEIRSIWRSLRAPANGLGVRVGGLIAVAARGEGNRPVRSASDPLSRVDHMGLVWLLKGERIIALTDRLARLERGQAVYRRARPWL